MQREGQRSSADSERRFAQQQTAGLRPCRSVLRLTFMNPTIWVAIIGGTAGLLTAALTYAVTKRREREADWRKLKLEMYRDFTTALAGMAELDATNAVKMQFSVASNALHLIASRRTVDALDAFRYQISVGNPNKNMEMHDRLLSCLFWEIRRDLGDTPTSKQEEFRVKLYNSGASQSN